MLEITIQEIVIAEYIETRRMRIFLDSWYMAYKRVIMMAGIVSLSSE